MNDFTKEELLILHLELSITIEAAKILKVPSHVIALRDKLQSLIDNYPDSCSEAIRKYHELED